VTAKLPVQCQICGYQTDHPGFQDLGQVRGNTKRFKERVFHLWKCPECQTLSSLDPVDFNDIYQNYPLNRRRLDLFAHSTLNNLLGRLKQAGLKKADSILDYGCGNGLWIQFIKQKGYANVAGYDPFVPEYAALPDCPISFDCVILNDTLEHVDDVRAVLKDCLRFLKPGGLFYVGTPDTWGVDMRRLERQRTKLHQPFHRVLVTLPTLKRMVEELGLKVVRSYRRSYLDTLLPFANYRFLDELCKAVGHDLDAALDPAAARILLKKPALLFWAFFGYFFPSAYEPAVAVRKPG